MPIQDTTGNGNDAVATPSPKSAATKHYPTLFSGRVRNPAGHERSALLPHSRSSCARSSRINRSSDQAARWNGAGRTSPRRRAAPATYEGARSAGVRRRWTLRRCHATNAQVSDDVHNNGLDAISADYRRGRRGSRRHHCATSACERPICTTGASARSPRSSSTTTRAFREIPISIVGFVDRTVRRSGRSHRAATVGVGGLPEHADRPNPTHRGEILEPFSATIESKIEEVTLPSRERRLRARRRRRPEPTGRRPQPGPRAGGRADRRGFGRSSATMRGLIDAWVSPAFEWNAAYREGVTGNAQPPPLGAWGPQARTRARTQTSVRLL